MLAAPVLAMTACAASVDRRPAYLDLRAAPAPLLAPCAAPVDLTGVRGTQLVVETLWGRDRAALKVCRARHDALGRYYVDRDQALVHGR